MDVSQTAAGQASGYSDEEERALGLASVLRDRVQRERQTVEQLKTFLQGDSDPT